MSIGHRKNKTNLKYMLTCKVKNDNIIYVINSNKKK